MNIVYAVLALGGVGLAAGLVLSLAAKLFSVKTDERLAMVSETLPGANCGACGYAGCQNLAQAILEGRAEVSSCPVGGEAVAETLAGILGVSFQKNMRVTALVRCSGGVRASRKYTYAGLSDCVAATRIGGGSLECSYGCLGLGTCVSACKFGAISVVDDVAVVDHERCTGCLRCMEACPRGIIMKVPYYADVNVCCSNHDKGASLRKICDIGCLGCRRCVKACQHGAIHVDENLAVIDYEKCTGCGDCAEVCPRSLIVDAKLDKGPRMAGDKG